MARCIRTCMDYLKLLILLLHHPIFSHDLSSSFCNRVIITVTRKLSYYYWNFFNLQKFALKQKFATFFISRKFFCQRVSVNGSLQIYANWTTGPHSTMIFVNCKLQNILKEKQWKIRMSSGNINELNDLNDDNRYFHCVYLTNEE